MREGAPQQTRAGRVNRELDKKTDAAETKKKNKTNRIAQNNAQVIMSGTDAVMATMPFGDGSSLSFSCVTARGAAARFLNNR